MSSTLREALGDGNSSSVRLSASAWLCREGDTCHGALTEISCGSGPCLGPRTPGHNLFCYSKSPAVARGASTLQQHAAMCTEAEDRNPIIGCSGCFPPKWQCPSVNYTLGESHSVMDRCEHVTWAARTCSFRNRSAGTYELEIEISCINKLGRNKPGRVLTLQSPKFGLRTQKQLQRSCTRKTQCNHCPGRGLSCPHREAQSPGLLPSCCVRSAAAQQLDVTPAQLNSS